MKLSQSPGMLWVRTQNWIFCFGEENRKEWSSCFCVGWSSSFVVAFSGEWEKNLLSLKVLFFMVLLNGGKWMIYCKLGAGTGDGEKKGAQTPKESVHAIVENVEWVCTIKSESCTSKSQLKLVQKVRNGWVWKCPLFLSFFQLLIHAHPRKGWNRQLPVGILFRGHQQQQLRTVTAAAAVKSCSEIGQKCLQKDEKEGRFDVSIHTPKELIVVVVHSTTLVGHLSNKGRSPIWYYKENTKDYGVPRTIVCSTSLWSGARTARWPSESDFRSMNKGTLSALQTLLWTLRT